MSTDINASPFQKGTIAKLDLFTLYLNDWLPVFYANGRFKEVNIIDFFSGSGCDSSGRAGSPLIILKTLENHLPKITKANLNINVILNEKNTLKYEKLKANVDSFNFLKNSNIHVHVHNESFSSLFNAIEESLRGKPNLIFIDQYGIKEVTTGIFRKLCSLETTDFMFFIASGYIKRFYNHKNYKKYIGWMGNIDFNSIKPSDIHRVIAEQYRKLASGSLWKYVIPFSIKKDLNIFGLIFCSNHILAADKFLSATWKINPENGEANYDINDDLIKDQISFDFIEKTALKKLDQFEVDVLNLIKSKGSVTNKELYEYSINRGILPSMCAEILDKAKKEHKLEHFSRPKINYKQYSDNTKNSIVDFKYKI